MTTQAKIDSYRIGTLAHKLRMLRFFLGRTRPATMVNMLVFKERATGAFSGQSGWQAAQAFLREMDRVQRDLGWRNVWTGKVQLQLLGDSSPVFEVVSLIEYPSPRALLSLLVSDADMSGRDAGLLGQVYLASTTRQEAGSVPTPVNEPADLDPQDLAAQLGVSAERFQALMAFPADEPIELVELLRYDEPGDIPDLSTDGLRWSGDVNQVLMGDWESPFHRMAITRCLGPRGVLSAMARERPGVCDRWAYMATPLSVFGQDRRRTSNAIASNHASQSV